MKNYKNIDKLINQPKGRRRVTKRGKIAAGALTGVLLFGIAYGSNFVLHQISGALNRAQLAKDKQIEEYVSNQESVGITKEMIDAVSGGEKYYNNEAIQELKSSILVEYGNLLNILVLNRNLYDGNQEANYIKETDNVIKNYSNFKEFVEKDEINYDLKAEEDRVEIAGSFYNTKGQLLRKQMQALEYRLNKLDKNSPEYSEVLEEINKIERKVNSMEDALDVIADENAILNLQENNIEQGRTK